jgi:hypothetical protein
MYVLRQIIRTFATLFKTFLFWRPAPNKAADCIRAEYGIHRYLATLVDGSISRNGFCDNAAFNFWRSSLPNKIGFTKEHKAWNIEFFYFFLTVTHNSPIKFIQTKIVLTICSGFHNVFFLAGHQ